MSKILNYKMIKAWMKIRSILTDNIDFKIGKTDDLERRKREHKNEGYSNFYVIAESETQESIDILESGLISLFRNKMACDNKNDGGGGRTSYNKKHYIYLVTK